MPGIKSLLKSGASSAWGPLVCVGVKAVVQVPADHAVGWLRDRFADHSQALPRAIVAANDRAWQAVELALATDGLRGRLFGRFRDGDLKAVRDAIRAFVAQAESGYDDATDPLRSAPRPAGNLGNPWEIPYPLTG